MSNQKSELKGEIQEENLQDFLQKGVHQVENQLKKVKEVETVF